MRALVIAKFEAGHLVVLLIADKFQLHKENRTSLSYQDIQVERENKKSSKNHLHVDFGSE